MFNVLSEILKQNKDACIYTNLEKTNKFHYGKILQVNEDEVAIGMITQDGEFDGILMKPIDSIYRVDVDGQYVQKMQKLCSVSFESYNDKLDANNIKASLLLLAQRTQKVISVELINSGYDDVVGFVAEVNNGICSIHIVDEYGFDDGASFQSLNDITQIRYASEDEERILKLWTINKNYNS